MGSLQNAMKIPVKRIVTAAGDGGIYSTHQASPPILSQVKEFA